MSLTVLLDGYSLLYRAYHALQTPMNAPDGTPTNALHAFTMMILRILETEKPDHVIAAFDPHAPSFRKDIFDGYKGSRKPMPDDLRAQDPFARTILEKMGIPIVEVAGFEADDVIGTLSRRIQSAGEQCLIVTGDRDSFQLVTDSVNVLYTRKGITDTVRVDPAWIRDTYGVEPAQLIDVKSLMGDSSDDIPGIAGIGEKTALSLIARYGDLENTLANAAQEKGKLRERLETGVDAARMSLVLARIRLDAPAELPEDHVDPRGALPVLQSLGMVQCARRCGELAPASSPAETKKEEFRAEYETLSSAEGLSLFAGRDMYLFASDALVSVCADGRAASLPLGGGDLLDPGVTREEALASLASAVSAAEHVTVYDGKSLPYDRANDYDDVLLAAYVLEPQRRSFALGELCAEAGVPFDAACPACSLPMLLRAYREQLSGRDKKDVYGTIELPLSRVLRDMENTGFCVDRDTLLTLKQEFTLEVARFEGEVYAIAGHTFNLNSPKQLSAVLYDELGLPAPRGKSRSTDADTLEGLRELSPVIDGILNYRKYKKLESTYVDALLRLMDPDGRVRTSFDQTATATGRISSNEPNLQNIPVRTSLGKRIRNAFVPAKGCVLIDADYSQIELRVLAHISGDENMREAFLGGKDIHASTASEVYGIPLSEVTGDMRSRAKAVNFGIVYGISDFTLARNTGTTRAEAKSFMDRYFERYPKVKEYMESSVKSAGAKGYAETLMGRRRSLPELTSSNFQVRTFGERCAMNSPIQGTAADIIKLAMIRTHESLRREGLAAKLILQVHDELILECPAGEADRAEELLRDAMENVIALAVPLTVEITRGNSWSECK